MKQLQNNFTTPEQSKRLLELGVPADSADCYIDGTGCPNIVIGKATEYLRDYNPCWSVGRLIEIYLLCCNETETFNAHIICNKSFYKGVEGLIEQISDDIEYLDFSKLVIGGLII